MKFRLCRSTTRYVLYRSRRINLRLWITVFLCIIFIYTFVRSGRVINDIQYQVKHKAVSRDHNGRENVQGNNSAKDFNNTNDEDSRSTYKTTIGLVSSMTRPDLHDCIRRKAGLISLSFEELPLTALASPFRSGNTWVRHLLQMATGIGTSALYCDAELHFDGFPFECNHTHHRQLLVVKTHEPRPPSPPKRVTVRSRNGVREIYVPQPPIKNPPFDRAVLLIRDPYNYLVGNMYTSHLDTVKEEEYFRESKWRIAQPGLLKWWTDFNDYWLRKFQGPVYPLLYSKLLIDTETELRKLLNFLNVTYTDSDIRCAIDNQKGNFRRKHFVWTRIKDIIELFNDTMKMKIDASVKILTGHLRTKYGIEWVNETHNVRIAQMHK